MTNHKLKMWWETARPKTLPLALASIFTGSALAYWADKESFNLTVMLLCLLTTILLQVLSNFANDYGDHQKRVRYRRTYLGLYVVFSKVQFLRMSLNGGLIFNGGRGIFSQVHS